MALAPHQMLVDVQAEIVLGRPVLSVAGRPEQPAEDEDSNEARQRIREIGMQVIEDFAPVFKRLAE